MRLMIIRTYSELIKINSYKDRYNYLQLTGGVGQETFGFDRYINQNFYRSRQWKAVRDFVIVRDNGCDLAMEGYEIHGKILIHHMNPISLKDIQMNSAFLMEPEYLISTVLSTHNAIHYGDENLLIRMPVERSKNDTCPWRQTSESSIPLRRLL